MLLHTVTWKINQLFRFRLVLLWICDLDILKSELPVGCLNLCSRIHKLTHHRTSYKSEFN